MLMNSLNKLLIGLSLCACASASAVPLVIDISNNQSVGLYGDPDNTVLNFNVGANARITAVSYSVNLTADAPSWLDEMALAFTDSGLIEGVSLVPGFFDSFPGTGEYAGFFDLVALDLDFLVSSDGILRLEFFELIDDLEGVDGFWNVGTITLEVEQDAQPVPEPASALLIGAGLAMMGYARRRRSASMAARRQP